MASTYSHGQVPAGVDTTTSPTAAAAAASRVRESEQTARTARTFKSARLHYRAIEDSDADFLHSIQNDVVAFANSNARLLVPETRASSREWQDYMVKKCLIAVIICLPAQPQGAEAAAAAGSSSTAETTASSTTSAAPAPTKAPADTPIGAIFLTGSSPQQSHHRNSHISVDIIAGYRGRGYGREAIEWIMDWGFRMAGLHRIAIETFSWNQGAVRLYSSMGFTLEGELREAYWFDGAWHSEICFSMLEREWAAIKRARSEKQGGEVEAGI